MFGVIRFFLCYEVNWNDMNRISGGGLDGTGDQSMIYNVCYSLGYFLYDLFLMYFQPIIRTQTAIIHHSIIFLGFYSGSFSLEFFSKKKQNRRFVLLKDLSFESVIHAIFIFLAKNYQQFH